MSFIKKIFKEAYSRLVKRKMQEFNVENRAYRLLDKADLPKAPGYFKELEVLRKIFEKNPHLVEEVKKKDDNLVDNMGQIKVNVKYPKERKKKGEKLPKDRQIIPKDTNFKVNKVPAGCIDFEIFLKIYNYKYNHHWTNEEIAEEFDLDERNVDDLLFYFKPFNNKVVDKKRFVPSAERAVDKTYIKICEILGRDVETWEKIPEYKREIEKVEEEKRLNEILDDEEVETEEQELKRIESIKFKHEKFFINQTSRNETNEDKNETDKDGVNKADELKNDNLKKDAKTFN